MQAQLSHNKLILESIWYKKNIVGGSGGGWINNVRTNQNNILYAALALCRILYGRDGEEYIFHFLQKEKLFIIYLSATGCLGN